MSYELKRSPRLSETIILEDGTKLEVSINVGRIASNFNTLYNRILLLQKGININNIEELGEKIIELMQLVFGNKNTEILISYYDEDWLEMIEMVVPFIEKKFIPLAKQYEEQKRQDAKKLYKASKNAK